jgi:hypothetical protein
VGIHAVPLIVVALVNVNELPVRHCEELLTVKSATGAMLLLVMTTAWVTEAGHPFEPVAVSVTL